MLILYRIIKRITGICLRISVCLILIIIICLAGCSQRSDRDITSNDLSNIGISDNSELENRNHTCDYWQMDIADASNPSGIEIPRSLQIHRNVTPFLPAPVILVTSFNPFTEIFDVTVTITNPYPIDVYDVRLIVFTNNSTEYLLNPDDYTTLWDMPSGDWLNPFYAFSKDQPNRTFHGMTQQSGNLRIYLPQGSGPITIAVDASIPSNCEEPYTIENFSQGILLSEVDSETDVGVTVLDWQNDTEQVLLCCPAITTLTFETFEQVSDSLWSLNLVNREGAVEGDYPALIIASSDSSSISLYDKITIHVTHNCVDDSNDSCEDATQILHQDTIPDCVDSDDEDWFKLYVTPNGYLTDSMISVRTNSGSVELEVYGREPGDVCPGELIGSWDDVSNGVFHLFENPSSCIYIRITSDTGRVDYILETDFHVKLTNIDVELYVATDDGTSGGTWPTWEAPDPDDELTLTHLKNHLRWCNLIWNQYGYNLVWDETPVIMSSQYYILETTTELHQMHNLYGRSTGKLSLYFVDQVAWGSTAWSMGYENLSIHNVNYIFSYYCPGVMYWQSAVAHEHGHGLGYLIDQYMFDAYDIPCGDLTALYNAGYHFTWLYCDPDACYAGNVMYYCYPQFEWDFYSFTTRQSQAIHRFHFNIDGNFPWY
jgi:hypothetical protein